jgi:hypothetical protein
MEVCKVFFDATVDLVFDAVTDFVAVFLVCASNTHGSMINMLNKNLFISFIFR